MWLFHHYSDLPSLLQCQSATNVTIVVQLHINKEKQNKEKKLEIWQGKSAPNYRENRVGHGKTEALRQTFYT